MIDTTVTVTFLAPQSLVKRIERVRYRRMKEAGGHLARSVLLREALTKLLEDEERADRTEGGTAPDGR